MYHVVFFITGKRVGGQRKFIHAEAQIMQDFLNLFLRLASGSRSPFRSMTGNSGSREDGFAVQVLLQRRGMSFDKSLAVRQEFQI
jgi:hypothetical protein